MPLSTMGVRQRPKQRFCVALQQKDRVIMFQTKRDSRHTTAADPPRLMKNGRKGKIVLLLRGEMAA
jgi:hypothetical protein